MSDQVEEVKQKTDVVSVIGEYVSLKKAGSNFKALCPFHSEKTPSFMVSQELQMYKCFGCGKGGDVFTFLQDYEGMEFYEALKYLADRAGVKLDSLNKTRKSNKEHLYQINLLIARFYHYILLNHEVGKKALSYLTIDRGITRESIETFYLGFAPDAPLAFKKYLIDKKGVSLKDLETVGVVYSSGRGAFDRFRGRVIFPLCDHRGNTIGFAGRILPGSSKKDIAKYINTPETPIYQKSKVLYGLDKTKDEIRRVKEAVVVEGELDLITCRQVGIKNIVAIKGSALTEEQTRLVSRFAKRLVLMLDADFAGDEAARRGIVIAEREGLEVKVARLSGFKDPDEAAKKDPDSLKNAIKNASGVWDFIINSVFSKYGGETGGDKAKISREIVPQLSSINNKIVQAHYANLVARKLDVPIEAVLQEISVAEDKVKSRPKLEEVVKIPSKSRREALEERLLAVIFRFNPKVLNKSQYTRLLTTPFTRRLIEEFQKFGSRVKTFDPSLFAEGLPKELLDGFVNLVLKDIGVTQLTNERLEQELNLIVRELKILDVKERLGQLSQEIKEFETLNKKEALRKSEEEFRQLAKDLSELEQGYLKGIIL